MEEIQSQGQPPFGCSAKTLKRNGDFNCQPPSTGEFAGSLFHPFFSRFFRAQGGQQGVDVSPSSPWFSETNVSPIYSSYLSNTEMFHFHDYLRKSMFTCCSSFHYRNIAISWWFEIVWHIWNAYNPKRVISTGPGVLPFLPFLQYACFLKSSGISLCQRLSKLTFHHRPR